MKINKQVIVISVLYSLSLWELLNLNQSYLSELVLGGGMVIIMLLGGLVYLAQKTQQNKNKIERFFHISLDLLFITNFDGRFCQLNKSWTTTLGYSLDQLKSQHFLDFVHPQDKIATTAAWEKVRQGETISYFENRYRCCDGSYKWLAWNAVPIVEESLVYAVARDITAQKNTQLELTKNQNLLRTVVTNIPIILYASDGQGIQTLSEGKGLESIGLQPGELVGKSLFDTCKNYPDIIANINQVLSGKDSSWTSEFRNRFFVNQGTPLLDENQQVQGLIGICYDITAKHQSESQLRTIINNISDAILIINTKGQLIFVNQSALTLFDRSEAELLEYFLGIPSVENQTTEICIRQNNHKIAIAEMRVTMITWQEEQVYLASLRDITQRKEIEEALWTSEQRLDGILSSMEDAVYSSSAITLEKLFLNKAIENIYGRPMSDFYEDSDLWWKIIHPEDRLSVKNHVEILQEQSSHEIEFRILRPDGQIRWIYNRSHVVTDNQGNPLRIDTIETDITQRKEAEAQLEHLAFYDFLTNLPNRTLFLNRLSHTIIRSKRRGGYLFAVLFLDLDEFKLINDSLGHTVGDKLLIALARRLESILRPSDTLARLGGDEFTIILEEIKAQHEAKAIAQRINIELKKPFNLEGYEIYTSMSIGIAFNNQEYEQAEDLLRDADTAMYRAKAQGKGCYAIFDQNMHSMAINRLTLETELRRALEREEFLVYYQPFQSLMTGKVTGFEALMRWRHPEKGLISPGEFIPIAEETGLIIPMGQWILHQACQQMQSWHQQFSSLNTMAISVNLSSKQIKGKEIIKSIETILKNTGLNNKCLKLEITETLFMENSENLQNKLRNLQELDIQLSLDDFGTGYSSLSYLHLFPINTLKIDRCFIKPIAINTKYSKIVHTIINLAHSLKMDVIAEGIETKEQLSLLKQLGCQHGQGYYFSKPLPPDAVEKWLSGKGLGCRV